MEADVRNMKETIKILSKSFDKLSDILSKMAVQETKVGYLEFQILELKHGRGWVQEHIGGEYPRPPLPVGPPLPGDDNA